MTELPPDMEINDNEFWDLYTDLVRLVYFTDPRNRLGIVVPELERRYGQPTSDVYERIENHVFRTVMYLETFKDRERIEQEVGENTSQLDPSHLDDLDLDLD